MRDASPVPLHVARENAEHAEHDVVEHAEHDVVARGAWLEPRPWLRVRSSSRSCCPKRSGRRGGRTVRANHRLLDTIFSMQGAPPFRGSAVRVEQGALSRLANKRRCSGTRGRERLVALPDNEDRSTEAVEMERMIMARARTAEADSSTAMGWPRWFSEGELINDAGIRPRFSSAADGDRVDISTHTA